MAHFWIIGGIGFPVITLKQRWLSGSIQSVKTLNWKVVLVCWMVVIAGSGVSAAKPSLSSYMQQQLVTVRMLMEKGAWTEAQQRLNKLKAKTSQEYATALIAQSLGQIAIHREDQISALAHFRQAYGTGSLPEQQNRQLLHDIGQLYCGVESWQSCEKTLAQWIQVAPEKVRSEHHIMRAYAYSMMEQWSDVIAPVSKALAAKINEGEKVPLAWHQLGVTANIQLQQWERAVALQQVLLENYPNKSAEWRQLVSLHLQNKDYKSALATQRLGYQRGLLVSPRDIRQVAELMAFNGLPFIAAKVIKEGLAEGVLKKNVRNLELQANLWLHALEYEQAADVYSQLVNIEAKKKWVKKLAELHITSRNWSEATRVLQSFVGSFVDSKADPNLNLLLGITLTNQQRYNEAKRYFEAASSDKELQSVVEAWLQYLQQV